jgi:hypothetical protein
MNDYIRRLPRCGRYPGRVDSPGDSYHVRANLARCAMRFMSLGKFDTYVPGTGEQNQLPSPDTITAQTPYGEYVRLAPPTQFSET